MNLRIVNGNQYIMNVIEFEDKNLLVNMDLFSAHYSPVTEVDSEYLEKSLQSISFTVPLDSKMGRYRNVSEKSLKEFVGQEFNYKAMTFGKYLMHGLIVILQSKKEGNQMEIRHQINMSNMCRPPSIISINETVEFHGAPSVSLFEDSKQAILSI
jgi:hypothetical protein